ncbi:MAG: hypothetical protein U0531_07845 [Dehalococcoidia bacterium]
MTLYGSHPAPSVPLPAAARRERRGVSCGAGRAVRDAGGTAGGGGGGRRRAALARIPGIGKKTAARIVLDLKGKLVSPTDEPGGAVPVAMPAAGPSAKRGGVARVRRLHPGGSGRRHRHAAAGRRAQR